MSKSGVGVYVVCEDKQQEDFIKYFLMEYYGWKRSLISRKVAFSPYPRGRGAGVQHVINEYRKARGSLPHNVILVGVVDTDKPQKTVSNREQELNTVGGQYRHRSPNDRYINVIPKRNIETWMYCAAGNAVDEVTDYKNKMKNVSSDDYKHLIKVLVDAYRSEECPADWPPSLKGMKSEVDKFIRIHAQLN